MDGTLVDSRAVVERTWHRFAAKRGLNAEAIIKRAHGRRSRETMAELVAPGEIDSAVAEVDGDELNDREGIIEVPGARALLASLPPQSWAVVTSAGRELAEIRMQAAGIPIPAVLVSAELVSRGKPDPEGYRLAAAMLGVPVQQTIVFEDAPPGIAAGIAAGAPVVALATTQPRERLAGATAIVNDFRGLTVSATAGGWLVEIA